jgi:hypothetical protein
VAELIAHLNPSSAHLQAETDGWPLVMEIQFAPAPAMPAEPEWITKKLDKHGVQFEAVRTLFELGAHYSEFDVSVLLIKLFKRPYSAYSH